MARMLCSTAATRAANRLAPLCVKRSGQDAWAAVGVAVGRGPGCGSTRGVNQLSDQVWPEPSFHNDGQPAPGSRPDPFVPSPEDGLAEPQVALKGLSSVLPSPTRLEEVRLAVDRAERAAGPMLSGPRRRDTVGGAPDASDSVRVVPGTDTSGQCATCATVGSSTRPQGREWWARG